MAKFEGERDTLTGFLRDLDVRLTRQERHTHTRGGHGGGGTGGLTPEEVFDLIATAIEAGYGIDVVASDPLDRVTISVTGLTAADVGLAQVGNYTQAPLNRPINTQTGTSYMPDLADSHGVVTLSNAAPITVTLPADATIDFADGAEVDFVWLGVGQPSFVAEAGATVDGTPGLDLRAQFSRATALKLASDTWLVSGDLA